MCSVIFGINAHSDAPLFFAANRDEWRARPTAPFGVLDQGIRGGKDLKAGGTWFAIRDDGAMAFLTNIRPGSTPDPKKKSRGSICVDILKAKDMAAFAAKIDVTEFNLFNVVFGQGKEWFHLHGEGAGGVKPIAPGLHVLGNLSLDHPDDAKTKYVQETFADLGKITVAQLKTRLLEALESDALTVDAGPYGTRWSMLYIGNKLAIAENGAIDGPLVEI